MILRKKLVVVFFVQAQWSVDNNEIRHYPILITLPEEVSLKSSH